VKKLKQNQQERFLRYALFRNTKIDDLSFGDPVHFEDSDPRPSSPEHERLLESVSPKEKSSFSSLNN
jgi:hypothetical protein